MSNRNDANSEFGIAAGIMAVSAILLLVVFYVVGLIIAALFTGFAVCAWTRPMTIGPHTITPKEAHFFVYAGIAGACVLPILIWFVAALVGIPVAPDMWIHFYLGGYVLGSIGLTALADKEGYFTAPPAQDSAPPPVFIAGRESTPEEEPEPFRFARWDDEERRP